MLLPMTSLVAALLDGGIPALHRRRPAVTGVLNVRSSAVATAALLATSLFAPHARTERGATQSTIVTVERSGEKPRYRVDSQRVSDLLLTLNRVAERNGPSHSVVVMMDSTLPLSEMWNVDGIAGKAQLTNVRFFVVFHETRTMSEMKRMPAVPVGTRIE